MEQTSESLDYTFLAKTSKIMGINTHTESKGLNNMKTYKAITAEDGLIKIKRWQDVSALRLNQKVELFEIGDRKPKINPQTGEFLGYEAKEKSYGKGRITFINGWPYVYGNDSILRAFRNFPVMVRTLD